jgi:hypothetical protein
MRVSSHSTAAGIIRGISTYVGGLNMDARHGLAVIVAIAAGACLPSFVYGAEQPLPKIREFDIPTIERLGREIHAQDQLAWKATDVASAQRGGERGMRRDGMKGWITVSADGRDVVRMVRVTRGGPEALYDVTFPQGAEPVFSTPDSRTLSAEEIAQYNARMLALNNIGQRCSDRYNTVALKDPESDGWLVWALASTTDVNLMLIGGHYRFTISADGKTVRAKDALFRGCLRFDKRERAKLLAQKKDLVEAGQMMSHVVSLTPIETHIFAGLTYEAVFHVGTGDGRAWRVDSGRLTAIDEDSPGEDGFTARALAGIAERCVGTVTNPNQVPSAFYNTKGVFKVIERTEHNPTFSLKVDPEFQVVGISCARMTIVPSPNDYKVVTANTALSIGDIGEGHANRLGTLKRANGKFTFEIIEGEPLTDELRARVDARLEAFDKAAQPAN